MIIALFLQNGLYYILHAFNHIDAVYIYPLKFEPFHIGKRDPSLSYTSTKPNILFIIKQIKESKEKPHHPKQNQNTPIRP